MYVKIVETSNTGLPQAYRWARKAMRIVTVPRPDCRGWLSEKGVSIIYESDHYNDCWGKKSKRTRIYKSLKERAVKMAQDNGWEFIDLKNPPKF